MRYVFHDSIQTNPLGTLVHATDTQTDTPVLLKELDLSVFPDVAALAARLEELRTINHPSLIPILDFDLKTDTPYYVMPWLEAPVPLMEAAAVESQRGKIVLLIQLTEAVEVLHQHEAPHGNLHPSTTWVSDGHVRLFDYGLPTPPFDFNYTAPEVIQGASLTDVADLFSLGLIAYEMYVGQHAFFRPTTDEQVQAMLEEAPNVRLLMEAIESGHVPPKILEDRPTVEIPTARQSAADTTMKGNPLVSVILRILNRNPVHRFSTTAVLLEALRRVANK